MEVLRFEHGGNMNCYIAELDDANRIAAVWVKVRKARGPSIFDPKKHVFNPQLANDFVGAPRKDIVSWLTYVPPTS